jgi:hypothetical protein
MKYKKKILISGIFILICAIVGISKIGKSEAASVKDNLNDELISYIDSSYKEEEFMSSNPYEYIKSNEYENIVKQGKESLPQLKKILEKQDSGLNSYIIALAMEEIAGVNIREETNIDWATSKEFLKAWNIYEENNDILEKNNGIKRSGPKRSNPRSNEELNMLYRFSNFYKRIICRDCEKARFDENFKDSFGNKRQFGIKFCNYHINNTAPEAEFVDYGYTDYNCLAYALGETGPCMWMWPSSWVLTL